MKDIAIYGAGGFGREVLTILQHLNKERNQYNFIGFFDDGIEKTSLVNGYPVLGGINELNTWHREINLLIAMGNPVTKKKIIAKISNNYIVYPTIIHPSVIIGDSLNVTIGKGSIICAGNIITCNIEIQDFVVLNLSCTVGHDTIIESYSSFMPSVNISGEVLIKEGVYVGTGAKIINQLQIGEWSTIGAGALVAKNIPDFCTAVGIPAKPIKFHNK